MRRESLAPVAVGLVLSGALSGCAASDLASAIDAEIRKGKTPLALPGSHVLIPFSSETPLGRNGELDQVGKKRWHAELAPQQCFEAAWKVHSKLARNLTTLNEWNRGISVSIKGAGGKVQQRGKINVSLRHVRADDGYVLPIPNAGCDLKKPWPVVDRAVFAESAEFEVMRGFQAELKGPKVISKVVPVVPSGGSKNETKYEARDVFVIVRLNRYTGSVSDLPSIDLGGASEVGKTYDLIPDQDVTLRVVGFDGVNERLQIAVDAPGTAMAGEAVAPFVKPGETLELAEQGQWGGVVLPGGRRGIHLRWKGDTGNVVVDARLVESQQVPTDLENEKELLSLPERPGVVGADMDPM